MFCSDVVWPSCLPSLLPAWHTFSFTNERYSSQFIYKNSENRKKIIEVWVK
jgi:hypothetical protein